MGGAPGTCGDVNGEARVMSLDALMIRLLAVVGYVMLRRRE
ncbi:MAG: hypothetical protein ACXQTY_01690 [Candidatus Methanogasteraceae archaeon]